jgi:hypothetical protein
MNRRSFLTRVGAIAAPAVIRPGILMPISVWRPRSCVVVTDFPVAGSRTLFNTDHSLEEVLDAASRHLDHPLREHEREFLAWSYRTGRSIEWGFPCREQLDLEVALDHSGALECTERKT